MIINKAKLVFTNNQYSPVINTPIIVNHNLNLADLSRYNWDVKLKCISPEHNYNIGDYAINPITKSYVSPDLYQGIKAHCSLNTIQVNASAAYIQFCNKTTNANTYLTFAKWVFEFKIWEL